MPAIRRFGMQCAQNLTRRLQGIDRLEQRSEVQRTFAAALVRDIRPSRQQQYRKDVLGTAGAAHDVLTDRAAAEFVPRLRDGLENPQAAPARRVEGRHRP